MIICPNCNYQNMTGAAFCMECGVLLLQADALTTQRMDPANPIAAAEPRPAPVPSPISSPVAPSDNWATLHLLDSGEMLPLASRNEFTLGRVSEGQSVMPDLDLGPYQAHSQGVSRLHAVVRRGVSNVMLMDLDSANGTFINGERLEPNAEHALAHGDVISLGGLKIQILLRSS